MPLDEAEKGRVLVGHAADRDSRLERAGEERVVLTAVDGAMRIGDGIAVRIDGGTAEHLVDALDESLGDGVFQVFRFVVHFGPAHPHHLY